MDMPYETMITIELFNSQINYYTQAMEAFNTDRSGAKVDKSTKSEPPLRTLLSASINYIAVKSIESIKRSIREFVDNMRRTVNNVITKILVQIGVDDDECIDRANIIEFIRMEKSRITSIQDSINKELAILKKQYKDKKSRDRYNVLSAKARMLGASLTRWERHTKPTKVAVSKVRSELNTFRSLVSQLDVCEAELNGILKLIKAGDEIDGEYYDRVKIMLEIITYSITAYTLIINKLQGSINPIARLSTNVTDTVKKVNPKNRYSDDADISVFMD